MRDFEAEVGDLDPAAADFNDKALTLALDMLCALLAGPYTAEERAAIHVEVVGPSRLIGRWAVVLVDARDGTHNQVRRLWWRRNAVRFGRRLADHGRLRYVDPDTPYEPARVTPGI